MKHRPISGDELVNFFLSRGFQVDYMLGPGVVTLLKYVSSGYEIVTIDRGLPLLLDDYIDSRLRQAQVTWDELCKAFPTDG
jgi:hypothetical protein